MVLVVLLRQDRGRSHQRSLQTVAGRGQHGNQRHDGLARAHIALQKAAHRHRLLKIKENIVDSELLSFGQHKGQPTHKSVHLGTDDVQHTPALQIARRGDAAECRAAAGGAHQSKAAHEPFPAAPC